MLPFVGFAAQAQLTVDGAWVRGTVDGQQSTGAFMRLKSAEGAALVGAETPVAGAVEIHTIRMEDSVMRMRSVTRVDLPAGRTVELKPGGYHFMLVDLKRPLRAGDSVPMRLRLEGNDRKVQEVDVAVEVRDLAGAGGRTKH